MCKYIMIISLLIVFASVGLAVEMEKQQTVANEEDDFKKVEVGFFFGPNIPQLNFKNAIRDPLSAYWYWESAYGYTEYDLNVSSISEMGEHSAKSVCFGGLFNYFFGKNFGFQFMLEKSSHNVPLWTSHGIWFRLDYYWGERDEYRGNSQAETTGSWTVMPISLNGIVRFNNGKIISGYASGGLTYYKADIEAESKVGYRFQYLWYEHDSDLYYLLYDMVSIPMSIDDSVGEIGSNFGVGIVTTFWKKVGILADFRYYHAPKKDVYWTLKPGDYTLLANDWYGPITRTVTQTDIDIFLEEQREFFQVEVNPSFFRFAFGLQFRF
ncbi:hypothetical protein CEE39_07530 [bacterium (candidate division B38) B3_B38]|nr:MAG: hypothetical protein CEE39_07530 [bacterium (candidate division B38) B3_B38]